MNCARTNVKPCIINHKDTKKHKGHKGKSILCFPFVSFVILCVLVVHAHGCSGYVPSLPQRQDQTADRNGPVVVQVYQGVQSFGAGAQPSRKLAETITITINAPATADGSVQGSASESAQQDGAQLGPVDQKAEGNLEIPLPIP